MDVWLGKIEPRHALVIVGQQINNPRSRMYVAARGGDIGWAGFDATTRATIGIYNLLAAIVHGLGAKAESYPLPSDRSPAVTDVTVNSTAGPSSPSGVLFAATVADFNPAAFMKAMQE